MAFLLALGAGGCGSSAGPPDVEPERLLRQGREAFVAGDLQRADDLFRRAAAVDPASGEAAFGRARSLYGLHQFGEALTQYENALRLAPDEALVWQGYIESLYWGGVHEGNGSRLEKVLEVGPAALSVAPDAVGVYENLLRAAAELGRLGEYRPLLERVAEGSQSPVLQAELFEARIEDAQRARNAAAGTPAYDAASRTVEELEAALRQELEAIGATAGPSSPPGTLYRLAAGYDLLGESGAAEAWLDTLDRTAEGRRLAAEMRYEQFLGEWVSAHDLDAEARISLADRWLRRFEPDWVSGAERYRAIRGMQFGVMVSAARAAIAAADERGAAGAAVAEEGDTGVAAEQPLAAAHADRLARVGRELARIDTGARAMRFVDTAGILARIPSHYVTAVRVADEGVEALGAGTPGLLHPATPATERQAVQRRYVALLKQLQGQALNNLGREEEAERALREAISVDPAAAGYAMLGGLMLDQDRPTEAMEAFVEALARGFGPGQEALEEQTRTSALEAAARSAVGADALERAVEEAARAVAEEGRRAILADAVDLDAPDFDLADLGGDRWRLSELAGDVVVLNFWATWCGPCIAELPHYQALVDEYAGASDVVFLAISTDSDPSVVPPFIAANGYSFNVLLDDGAADDFGIYGVPASLLVGGDGRIKYRTFGFPGPQRYLREMRVRIEALRAAPSIPSTESGQPGESGSLPQ